MGRPVRRRTKRAVDLEDRRASGQAMRRQWGGRRGELLGLRWADVDLDGGALAVVRTLSRGATSRLEAGEPKTKRGKRRVALPPSVVAALRAHRDRQAFAKAAAGPAYADRDLVFATATGDPIHPNTLARRFAALIARAGVPRIRFHDLRHTCASLMLAAGVQPEGGARAARARHHRRDARSLLAHRC